MNALAHFKSGGVAMACCYKAGCEGVRIGVGLGREIEIHPSFVQGGGAGRLHWRPGATTKGFMMRAGAKSLGQCQCPQCHTWFDHVVIISNGKGRKPTIFAYEPEPA